MKPGNYICASMSQRMPSPMLRPPKRLCAKYSIDDHITRPLLLSSPVDTVQMPRLIRILRVVLQTAGPRLEYPLFGLYASSTRFGDQDARAGRQAFKTFLVPFDLHGGWEYLVEKTSTILHVLILISSLGQLKGDRQIY